MPQRLGSLTRIHYPAEQMRRRIYELPVSPDRPIAVLEALEIVLDKAYWIGSEVGLQTGENIAVVIRAIRTWV